MHYPIIHYPRYTALHMAALQNKLEDVRQLCTPENVNHTAEDRQHLTALHCVVLSEGDTKIKKQIIAYLLSNGADINAVYKGGDSAVFLAADKGKQEIVEFLILK